MGTAELKLDLHNKIDSADDMQLKELYGIVTNYLNGNADEGGLETLGEKQRAQFLKGVAEADAGLGTPLSEINARLRSKYRLNG